MKKTIAAVVLALSLAAGYGYLTEATASARVFPGTSTTDSIKTLPAAPINAGHMGFVPTDGTATVCEPGASSEDYIETLQGISLDAITLSREDAIKFFTSNDQTDGTFPDEIAFVVLVNPYDTDWKGDSVYLSAYDKDGCYWGQAMWDNAHVKAGLTAIGYNAEGVKE